MADPREYPLWAAIRGISEGMSGRAALAAYRAGGGHVANGTWFTLYGQAQAGITNRGDEPGRALNRRPTPNETTTWATRGASGYLQQVDVYVRNRVSGALEIKPYSVTGDRLVSRQKAAADALDLYTANSDEYDEQVLGAVHVGAYTLDPLALDEFET